MAIFDILWIVLLAVFTWAAAAFWVAAARSGSRLLALHGAVVAAYAIAFLVRLVAGDMPVGDILFSVLLAGATLYELRLNVRLPLQEELARHGITQRSLLLFQRPRAPGDGA